MKANHYTLLLLLLIMFASCKRTRLIDEMDILEGKWRAEFLVTYNYGVVPVRLDTIWGGQGYEIEFFRKGKVVFFKDGELIEKQWFRISTFELDELRGPRDYYFLAYLNKAKESMSGWINPDTLVTKEYFPEEGKTPYQNQWYFVRD